MTMDSTNLRVSSFYRQEGNVLGPINAPWQLLILAIDFFKSLDPDLNPLDERMSHRLLAWQSHYIGALCFFYIDFSADFPFCLVLASLLPTNVINKCLSDESLVIPLEELRVDDKLHFVEEPVEVMDREIKQLKRSLIPIIKIWYDEDVHDLRSVETKFPAIIFNDSLTSNETLSCEPTKIISANDLKTDSENDNEKVNMPLFPSLEPSVSCIDDLDFFKDFESEFSALVYNDALTSKLDFSTEPTLCPQHINEFDLKDETSLSEYDEVEQNVLYFNDLFPFNIIYPDDLKSDKDNDDNEIDMIQSSRDMEPLPPRDQRHLWLCYQVEGYTEEIVHDFVQRLEMIFRRQVNRVHTLDFEGVTLDMRKDLAERLRMVYTGDDGQELEGARRSMTWRQFILALSLHTAKEMAEDGFGAYWLGSERVIPDKGDLSDYWVDISFGMDFLSGAPHAEGRKSGARLSGGHFIGHFAHHFGLVSDDGLRGLSVMTRVLPLIDIERQPVVAAAALGDAKDAPDVDEGRLDKEIQGLRQDVRSLRGLMERSMTDQGRFSTWMVSCMTQLMEARGRTYQEFDGTFRGSYPAVFERRTKHKTNGASTSTAQTNTGSKFSTIVHEYVTEPSMISKSREEFRRESVYKSVEVGRKKSNLKTSL
ncbi:hypothetical protein Tco_0990513 [Tanacetum coccineum]|uniref:Aminotransferase-like plant mobile domain-containing protein n=1 Tax=Tanacetum coccineum TaxID=301880 RepID=A0ABQ5EWX5_9ASTR